MRHFKLAFALISVLIAGTAGLSFAADTAALVTPVTPVGKITVKTAASDREVRDYKVNISIKGSMANPETNQPMDLDTSMVFKIKHKYSKREGDGLLPMETSLTEGDVTISGQTLSISPSIYPKLTVLLDRTFRIDDIFGVSDSAPGALPGVNYANMSMLFYVPGLSQPRSVGESWDSTVVIPSLKEAYNVKSTLKAISKPDAKPATVTIRQEIVRVSMPNSSTPPPSMKATVESIFSQDNGKLLSSHIECEVIPTQPSSPKDTRSKQDTTAYRANIKMDVSLVK